MGGRGQDVSLPPRATFGERRDHEDRGPGRARACVFRIDHELHEAGTTVPELPPRRAARARERRRPTVAHVGGPPGRPAAARRLATLKKKNRKTRKKIRPPHLTDKTLPLIDASFPIWCVRLRVGK